MRCVRYMSGNVRARSDRIHIASPYTLRTYECARSSAALSGVRKQEERKETRPPFIHPFLCRAKISLLNFHLAAYKRKVKIKRVVSERAKRCVCVHTFRVYVCVCMCAGGEANDKILMPPLYAVSAEYFIKTAATKVENSVRVS